MYLFNIGPIEFNLGTLISFIIGLAAGFLIMLLVYLYAVLRTLRKGLRTRKVDEEDIDEEEIKWLIEDGQKEFKNKEKRKEEGYGKMLARICRELSLDISKKFYPKSKYPYFELTIDEILLLLHYIQGRLDELFSHRILKMFKGLTIGKIIELNETKTSFDKSKTGKAVKTSVKVATSTTKVINAINPIYWIRKITIDKALSIVLNKIGLALIAITGEETYKIYSKKVFAEERELDSGIDSIYDDIAKEFKEAGVVNNVQEKK